MEPILGFVALFVLVLVLGAFVARVSSRGAADRDYSTEMPTESEWMDGTK